MKPTEARIRNSTSKSFQKLNPHLFQGGSEDHDLSHLASAFTPEPEAKPKKRIKQSQKPLLNKLESEFFAQIKNRYPNYPPVRPQAVKLQLARSVFYKPDFFAASWPAPNVASKPTAWEVKGMRGKNIDRGKLALKVAASAWPEIRFVLVWKDNGKWLEQEVLP